MSTIDDVAKLAGLSKSTVSRVINNYPHVSDIKRRKVVDAMNTLGYVPNYSARSLRSQRTGLIAVLIPRIINPFFSQLIQSMEIAASEYDYQLIMCQTMYSRDKELKYLELLKRRQVDGVILASIQNEWDAIEPFLQYGPIILCNEFEEQANVPSVRLDQEYGGYIATKHLLSLGHTKIAYCAGGIRSNVAKHRELGFVRALREHSILFDESLAFRDAYSIEDGFRVLNWIKSMEQPPTAVFAGGDEVAAGIIAHAKMYDVKVPEELAVIGFDDQAITAVVEPNISTIRQPVQMMAQQAVELMSEKIETREYLKKEVYEFPLELIIRQSTFNKSLLSTT